MDAIEALYSAAGWATADVGIDKVGWDLTCTHRDGRRRLVKIKGTSGSKACDPVDRERTQRSRIRVVLDACSRYGRLSDSPLVREYPCETLIAAAQPFLVRVDLADSTPVASL